MSSNEFKVLLGLIIINLICTFYQKKSLEKMTSTSEIVSQENLLAIKNLGELAGTIMPDGAGGKLVLPGDVEIEGKLKVSKELEVNTSKKSTASNFFKIHHNNGNFWFIKQYLDKNGSTINNASGKIGVYSSTDKKHKYFLIGDKPVINGNITVKGDVSADGNITTDGTISATGNITTDGIITAGGKEVLKDFDPIGLGVEHTSNHTYKSIVQVFKHNIAAHNPGKHYDWKTHNYNDMNDMDKKSLSSRSTFYIRKIHNNNTTKHDPS